jgi:hypothetical protein
VNVRRNCTRLFLPKHQMQVVRHDVVPVQVDRDLAGGLGQNRENSLVVCIFEEELATVIAPVGDVNGNANRKKSLGARRKRTLLSRTTAASPVPRESVSARPHHWSFTGHPRAQAEERCLAPCGGKRAWHHARGKGAWHHAVGKVPGTLRKAKVPGTIRWERCLAPSGGKRAWHHAVGKVPGTIRWETCLAPSGGKRAWHHSRGTGRARVRKVGTKRAAGRESRPAVRAFEWCDPVGRRAAVSRRRRRPPDASPPSRSRPSRHRRPSRRR